jgi:hypothetical protein
MRTRAFVIFALLALALLGPAVAEARAPTVTTGGVANVTSSSALLKGTVNPQGKETAYYFQIGTTKAYGVTTPAVNAGSGTSTLPIAQQSPGLAGFTTYHYRIVGVSAGGTSVGTDHSFTTAKIPLSLQIGAAPNPVTFGGTVIVQGTLTGTGNANRMVMLEANPFPYTGGFHPIDNTELTNGNGTFSFAVLGLGIATQFMVVSTGHPTISSPIVGEGVAVNVVAHVRKARGRLRERVFGTVTPALNGAMVAIEKINRKHRYVAVGGTVLRAATSTSSTFDKVVRVKHAGVYRVLIQSPGGAYASNYSAPIVVR